MLLTSRSVFLALMVLLILLVSPAHAQNLITNGDFSAGNTGFSSQYTYITGGFTGPGQYSVIKNPSTAFTNGYASFGDHTTSAGNMLFADGEDTSVTFWSQTVTVAPNTAYTFSFWATPAYAQNTPTLRVLVDGVQVGTDFAANSSPGTWKKFTASINSGSKTSLTLSLRDVNANWSDAGNDFCVDDLSLTRATPAGPSVIDFNGDGKADLIFQNSSSHQMAAWYMNNTTRLAAAYITPNQAAGWNCVGTADFNKDGKPDLLWHNPSTGQLAIWYLNNTSVLAGVVLTLKQAAGWNVVALADMNQDGWPDIVFQNATTRQLVVWFLNNYTVTAGAYVSPIPPAGWNCVGSGDANGDGKPDLFYRNASTGQLAVGLMNGVQQTVGYYLSLKQASGWNVVAVSDMNRDGKPDLVFQNGTSGQMAVWYLNGGNVTAGAYLSASAPAGWTCVGPK